MALETDKRGGFKVTLREQIPSGAYLDTFSTRVPLWSLLRNVRSGRMGIEKTDGASKVVEDSQSEGPIRGALTHLEGTSRQLFYGDLENLYQYSDEGSTVTIVGTGYTGALDAGATIWDNGNTVWDSGATLWDDGVVPATLWSMDTVGQFIVATNGVNHPQIRTTNGTFNSLHSGVAQVLIDNPGAGYTVGDAITASGTGSGFSAEVSAVGVNGEIEEVRILDGGVGYTSAPTLSLPGSSGIDGALTARVGNMHTVSVTSAEVLVVRGPHVLAFNTSNSSKEYIWSSAGDPLDWEPRNDNSAGFQEIYELDTAIVAAEPLGDQILVYGEDQVFGISYAGAPFYFPYRPLVGGVGAVSKASIVSIGHRHIGLSRQGFFVTDGVSFNYIDDPAVRDFYERVRSAGQLSKTVGYHNEQYSEVRFSFPSNEEEGRTQLCFNYETGTWYIADLPPSYGVPRQLFSYPIIGTDDGRLLFYGGTEDLDGEAMEAIAQTKAMDFDTADRVKEIDQLRIGFTGLGAGLRVRIGWADTENAEPIFGPYHDVDPGYPMIHTRVAGRWLTLEISSDVLNTDWRVTSIDIIGRVEGTR